MSGDSLVGMTHPAAPDELAVLASWNEALSSLEALVVPDANAGVDDEPYGTSFGERDEAPIPSPDLPFGLPPWHGVGAHGSRDGDKKLVWTAP
jgi:hypothetical protein